MKPDRDDNHAEALKSRKGVNPLDITMPEPSAKVEPIFNDIIGLHCRAVAVASFVANQASKAKS
jgi:hypothetical protein